MNQIAQISSIGWTSRQLDTIKRTVAHDTNEDEFNLFIEYARSKRLDPFSKQIIAVVYSKDNPEEAQDDHHRDAGRPARARLPLPRLSPAEAEPEFVYNADLKGRPTRSGSRRSRSRFGSRTAAAHGTRSRAGPIGTNTPPCARNGPSTRRNASASLQAR
jgi:hypothetical protein